MSGLFIRNSNPSIIKFQTNLEHTSECITISYGNTCLPKYSYINYFNITLNHRRSINWGGLIFAFSAPIEVEYCYISKIIMTSNQTIFTNDGGSLTIKNCFIELNMIPSFGVVDTANVIKTSNVITPNFITPGVESCKYVIPTSVFTISNEFTRSAQFTQTNEFSLSNCFTTSKQFTRSKSFTTSELFTNTNLFSESKLFTNSNQFSSSITFTDSNTFTSSKSFSDSDPITSSKSFSDSDPITSSKSFSDSDTFTSSKSFSDSITATTNIPIYIYQANSITLTVTNILSITISQSCQYSKIIYNSLYMNENESTYKCEYIPIYLWTLIPTQYKLYIYEDSRPNTEGIRPEIIIGIVCGVSGGLLAISMIVISILRKPSAIIDYDLMYGLSEQISDDGQNEKEARTNANTFENPIFSQQPIDDPFHDDFSIS